MMGLVDRLEFSYGEFARIERAFHAALDESLQPRGPDVLYDLVAAFGLSEGAVAVDVGCGDGRHSFRLADRFGFTVVGVDPLAARGESGHPRVRFEVGAAEALPLEDESADLVWCRDAIVHVADLDGAYGEFARVLRPGSRALVYQMFAGGRLEPREAASLWAALGVVAASTDPARAEAAIVRAGLRLDERVDLTTEWGEWAEEQEGKPGRRLLWAARLLREPGRYVARFGRDAYEVMLGDCLWHVYGMLGKLDRKAYVLTKA
jgi:SAM-dependent methyltransferase